MLCVRLESCFAWMLAYCVIVKHTQCGSTHGNMLIFTTNLHCTEIYLVRLKRSLKHNWYSCMLISMRYDYKRYNTGI